MSNLESVEMVYKKLIKSKDDIIISGTEAYEIYRIFRPNVSVNHTNFSSKKNRAFMQAAWMLVIDGSKSIGYIRSVIFETAYSPKNSVKSFTKKLVKAALKHYYKNNVKGEIVIYQSVVNSIAIACKSNFELIKGGIPIP